LINSTYWDIVKRHLPNYSTEERVERCKELSEKRKDGAIHIYETIELHNLESALYTEAVEASR
jgi:hypothetical protein